MSRTAGIFIVLLLVVMNLHGQVTTISGTVLDASNNKPVPNVSVYFNNTTLGSSTDHQGRFVITKVPVSHPVLVVSAIGYRTVNITTLNISPGVPVTLDIKIVPQATMLAPVTITAGKLNSNWSRRYRDFKRILLGNTGNADHCEILNPEVISFTEDPSLDDNDVFTAHSMGPIEIENRGLGYKLSVTISEFESRKHSYRMLYSTRFDSLKPKNEREQLRWEQSRMDTYKGSQRHFLMSVAEGTYAQEGFTVYYTTDSLIVTSTFSREALLSDLLIDSATSSLKVLKKGSYQIHYSHKVLPVNRRNVPNEPTPVSWLRVSDQYLRLHPYGEVITPANFWRSGYMDDMRLADLLPYDYDANGEEARLRLQRFRESVIVQGTVVDEAGKGIPGVEVFINNGLTGTTTNIWGNFELPPMDPGKYPLAFSRTGCKDTLLIVDGTIAATQSVNVTLKRKPFRPQVVNADRERHRKTFEYFLFKPTGAIWTYELVNPGVLQFEQKKRITDVWTTAPLIVENVALGYQWTLFIKQASMNPRKLTTFEALVKMDTLGAERLSDVRRWERNRLEKYLGSWNHFISSLQNGTSGQDGFNIYQVNTSSARRKQKFKKLSEEEAIPIEGDSILSVSDGLMHLNMIPGMEIHNSNRKRGQKYYRGMSREVMRFSSGLNRVPMSRTGIVDPGDLAITGSRVDRLPVVPVDMPSLSDKATNPELLLILKHESLAQVKTLFEKVYVQTDRSHYNPGDTVWLKAYMRYAAPYLADSHSKVLYVDMLDPTGKVVSNAVLKIGQSQAQGVLPLDANLPRGNYYLRAYTNWMRNFDEIFIMPVPLIARGDFIEPGVREVPSSGDSIQVTLTSDRDVYKTSSPVVLKMHVSVKGADVGGIVSVAVTDQSAVPELAVSSNISDLLRPFKATGAEFIRINHPVEKGITLDGKIPNAPEETPYDIWLLLTRDSTAVFTTSRDGKFNFTLDFVDTTTAIIKAGKGLKTMRTEISEQPSLRTLSLPSPPRYNLATRQSIDRVASSDGDSTMVLQEVTVKATRIAPNPVFRTPTEARFGFPQRVGEGEDLHVVRENSNLMDWLRSHILYKFDNTRLVIEGGGYSPFGAMPAGFKPGDPLYELWLDGNKILHSEFHSIPFTTISRIEIFQFTSYAIAIYTESVIPYNAPEYDKYKVRGYDPPALFRIPSQSNPDPDTRPTVYWNPDVKVDDQGNAIINFRTSDVDGPYKVVIEGLTFAGDPFRVVRYLKVE